MIVNKLQPNQVDRNSDNDLEKLSFRYLTNEGIEYLRIFLHLPPEIVPATLKRSVRTETVRRSTVGRPDAPARSAEDRSAYRRAPPSGPDGVDKKADVGPGSAGVEFVSTLYFIVSYCIENCLKMPWLT